MEMLIQCVEEMGEPAEFEPAWLAIEPHLVGRAALHRPTIAYWASLDEADADACFSSLTGHATCMGRYFGTNARQSVAGQDQPVATGGFAVLQSARPVGVRLQSLHSCSNVATIVRSQS